MPKLLGLIFSARPGGNLADLAQVLFARISAQLPELETDLIEVAGRRVEACNGCTYECLLGARPGQYCPIDDDVPSLWRSALGSDLLVYFLPTYGGLPPATWVAFQQRYHGFFRLPEASRQRLKNLAVLQVCDPEGSKQGDISQQVILHTLTAGTRRLIGFEQVVPSRYGLNSLQNRLVEHEGVRKQVGALGERIVQAYLE